MLRALAGDSTMTRVPFPLACFVVLVVLVLFVARERVEVVPSLLAAVRRVVRLVAVVCSSSVLVVVRFLFASSAIVIVVNLHPARRSDRRGLAPAGSARDGGLTSPIGAARTHGAMVLSAAHAPVGTPGGALAQCGAQAGSTT